MRITLTALVPRLPRIVAIAAVVAMLAAITLAGARQSARANNLPTSAKIAPLVVVSSVGLPVLPSAPVVPAATAIGHVPAAVVLLFSAFVGRERSTTLGGEILDPRPACLERSCGLIETVRLGSASPPPAPS